MEAGLDPVERIRLHVRPHGAALVRPLGRAVLVAAAGAACIRLGTEVYWALDIVGAAALGAAALLALATVWEWDRTDVLLTSEKLRVVWGVLRRRVAEVRLDRNQPIEVEQGILGRMLGYGTLVAGGLEVPYVPLSPELSGRM